jgi:hypothetical protein
MNLGRRGGEDGLAGVCENLWIIIFSMPVHQANNYDL